VGHVVNHPPPGTPANVVPLTYDVPVGLPPAHLARVPNRYYRAPSLLFMREACALRTVLLVTVTHLWQGGELFLEYAPPYTHIH
jgi:hypothetical protein